MSRIEGGTEAVPKTEYLRSEAYRRLVAKTPCRICGDEGRNQAAHPNSLSAGGSAGGKASDILCFALCSVEAFDHHRAFDQYEYCKKEDMPIYEKLWARETQDLLIAKSQEPGREAMRLRETLRAVGLVK